MFSRAFVVALLLALIGQAYAAPMHCAKSTSDNGHEAHQNMMKHDMQAGDDLSHHQKTEKPSCCDNDCSCPATTCSSILIIANYSMFRASVANHQKISQLYGVVIKPDIPSLFRPPIFS